MAQAPGPRGSPHEPQGPAARGGAGAEPREPTANVESWRAGRVAWQRGHDGSSPERVRRSKRWPHWLHEYS